MQTRRQFSATVGRWHGPLSLHLASHLSMRRGFTTDPYHQIWDSANYIQDSSAEVTAAGEITVNEEEIIRYIIWKEIQAALRRDHIWLIFLIRN